MSAFFLRCRLAGGAAGFGAGAGGFDSRLVDLDFLFVGVETGVLLGLVITEVVFAVTGVVLVVTGVVLVVIGVVLVVTGVVLVVAVTGLVLVGAET